MPISDRTSELRNIPLTELRPNPDQPRKTFSDETLAELAASIDRHGLIQPIVAVESEDGFTIVAGERRFRAIRSLGQETAPVLVLTDGVTDELALVENIQREDLHPLEEAEAMQSLMDRHGHTHESLAEIVGKARPTITNTLQLNKLPERIKEECRTSKIANKSLLLEILALPEAKRLDFWDRIKEGPVTVRKARATKTSEPRPPGVAAVRAGAAFRRYLEALRQEGPVEPAQMEALRRIYQDVGELLDALEMA